MKTLYIIFLIFLAVISSPLVWGQNGLTGPFVPIGVETVHTNGTVSDVQMLYRATTTSGQDVYASGVSSMTEQQVISQAFKKTEDPNGGGVRDRFEDEGWSFEPPVGGSPPTVEKDGEDDDSLLYAGYCNNPSSPMNLSECISLSQEFSVPCSSVNPNTTPCQEYVGTQCSPQGGNTLLILYDLIKPAAPNEEGVARDTWTATAPGFTLCDDNPGGFAPEPFEPEPAPDEFRKYMSGDPAPAPNPDAPNPRPDGFPPPMMDPDFYRQSGSQQFDMQLPSSPTPQQLSDQMTADYSSFTSTSAPLANPLPTGMSFQPPPSGGSGSYGSPLSEFGTYGGGGSVGGGSSGSGSGSGGEGGDTEITVNVDVPDICETNPNSLACVDTNVGDEIVPDITVPSFDAGVGFSPVSLSNISGCPSPVSIDFLGDSFDIEYTIICDFGSSVSPLMLLFSSISAAMIMLGIRRTG